MAESDLWTCPECGNTFVIANMWHSCGRFELDALFERSEPQVIGLYRQFEALVRSVGEIKVIPQKTRISFQAQVRFIGVYPRKNYFLAGFWLKEERTGDRFRKIEQYGPHDFVHQVEIHSEDDFDHWLLGLIREAFKVGERRHIR